MAAKLADQSRMERLNAPVTATTARRRAELLALLADRPGNTADAQLYRLLAALRTGPVTTVEAGRFLDILHPPARVLGLRLRGHNITTAWVQQRSAAGYQHRVGQYHLHDGAPA